MKVSQVKNCMFHKWYPRFRNVSLKTEIIPLDEEFIRYLNEDGIFIDEKAFPNPQKYDRYDENEEEWPEEQETDLPSKPNFPELEAKIVDAIEKLDGAVFPKMNWSSPKDATWMSTGETLKCTNASEIFLLLKSSDFICHDLAHAFDNCCDKDESDCTVDEFVLVLRKWYDIKPSMEFRCFVKEHHLVGVSQRDSTTFYSFLLEKQAEIMQKIKDFYTSKILHQFPDDTYVFDVYLTKNMKVFLVDFNPWGEITEPLLFEWEELKKIQVNHEDNTFVEGLDFRIVTSQTGIRPKYSQMNRLPADLASMDSNSLADLLQRMQNEHVQS